MFKKRFFNVIALMLVIGLIVTGCANTDAESTDTVDEGQPEESVAEEVYEGSAEGRNGDIKVAVTIEDEEITDIELVEHEETDGYWEEAYESVKDQVIENQDLDVDVVAGATITSEALVEAIKDAIEDSDLSDLAALPVDEDGNVILPEPATLLVETGANKEGKRNFEYETQGNTCSTRVTFVIDEEERTVEDIVIHEACDGNARGFCALADGEDIDRIITQWYAIDCHASEGSSCPDQIALALNEARKIVYGEALDLDTLVSQK